MSTKYDKTKEKKKEKEALLLSGSMRPANWVRRGCRWTSTMALVKTRHIGGLKITPQRQSGRYTDSRMILRLKPLEIQVARLLAGLRASKALRFGHGPKESIESHFLGLCGEIAIAQHYGVEIDFSIYEGRGDRLDMNIKGHPVDIKVTSYFDDPFLRVEKNNVDPAMIYFCCAIKGNKVKVAGWIKGEDLIEKAEQRQLHRNGPMNYVLKSNQLNPLTKRDSDPAQTNKD